MSLYDRNHGMPASYDAWRTAGPPEVGECEDCECALHEDDAHLEFDDFVCGPCGDNRLEEGRGDIAEEDCEP